MATTALTPTPVRPPSRPRPVAAAPRPAPRPPRDHAVDAARALGTLAVVLLHWVMVEAAWDGTTLRVGNALAHGHAWLLTWLNPLPVLFFAAGAAAAYDVARRPETSGRALALRRLRALVRPVGALAAFWAGAALLLPLLGVAPGALTTAALIVVQPLWFLPVYLAAVMMAPGLLRAMGPEARGGVGVVAALTIGALALDAARWTTGDVRFGWPTLVVGWAVPFALGLLHARRRAAGRPLPRGAGVGLLVGGLLATVLLVAAGPYPVSLIGMPGDAVSNLGPPTAPVVTFAIAQVGLVVATSRGLAALGVRSRLLRSVGAHSMPIYLWHLTAAFAVTGVVVLGLGQELPASWGWDWWTTRPAFLGACALVLGGLVALAGRGRAVRATGRAPGRDGENSPRFAPASGVSPG